MIDRRDLIARLGGTIFVWPPQVRGQEPGRTYRVGWLSGLPHDAPTHVALYDGLSRLGFVEGQTCKSMAKVLGCHPTNSRNIRRSWSTPRSTSSTVEHLPFAPRSRQRSASDLRPCTKRLHMDKAGLEFEICRNDRICRMGKTAKIPDESGIP